MAATTEVISSGREVAVATMVVVEQQVHQRFTQRLLSKHVVLRFRRVMLQQSVRFRDYSDVKKLQHLLRSVTTLVPAVYQLLSVS